METLTNTECESIFGPLPENFLCTNTTEAAACTFDEGGYVGRQVNGRFQQDCVLWFVVPNACDSAPNGCTEVYPYLDWIQSVVGDNQLHFKN